MKYLYFLISYALIASLNAAHACPDEDNTATPLVYGIHLPTANYENGINRAETFFQKSVALNEPYGEQVYNLFKTYKDEHGNEAWSRDTKLKFLKEASHLGVGYASFAYASKIWRENQTQSARYIKKAVEQNYLPAFEVYADYLSDLEYEDISSLNYPQNRWVIYDSYKVSISHGCALPKYMLAQYIYHFIPEKEHEVIPLLLDYIDDKDALPSHREDAIIDLCVLGVGKANALPIEERWCSKSFTLFRKNIHED
ncbi:hypothetical protein [Terasakiella sp. SH-1]|uniref:hypothetical protein n=1 Tax=Terasakiella sp. SH-1 TaxID=2560057 RepID=UPI001072F3D4|nr:hypothetical protein [Terasakiella sp. SH-1]